MLIVILVNFNGILLIFLIISSNNRYFSIYLISTFYKLPKATPKVLFFYVLSTFSTKIRNKERETILIGFGFWLDKLAYFNRRRRFDQLRFEPTTSLNLISELS